MALEDQLKQIEEDEGVLAYCVNGYWSEVDDLALDDFAQNIAAHDALARLVELAKKGAEQK